MGDLLQDSDVVYSTLLLRHQDKKDGMGRPGLAAVDFTTRVMAGIDE